MPPFEIMWRIHVGILRNSFWKIELNILAAVYWGVYEHVVCVKRCIAFVNVHIEFVDIPMIEGSIHTMHCLFTLDVHV